MASKVTLHSKTSQKSHNSRTRSENASRSLERGSGSDFSDRNLLRQGEQVSSIQNGTMVRILQDAPTQLQQQRQQQQLQQQQQHQGNVSSASSVVPIQEQITAGTAAFQRHQSAPFVTPPNNFVTSDGFGQDATAPWPMHQPYSCGTVQGRTAAPAIGIERTSEPITSSSPRAQYNAVEEPSTFKSCQAQMNLWQRMLIVDPSCIQRGPPLAINIVTEVYKGRVSGFECTIKLYRKTASAKELEDAMFEIRLVTSLDHPCTLRILGWTRDPLQVLTEPWLGDLSQFYTNKIQSFPYNELKALQLLRVGYFESFNTRHPDTTH